MEEDFDATAMNNEEDLCLPKATMAKIIQKIIPTDIICPKETRDMIADCCIEFIHLISSEANEICKNEAKKTITGNHVVAALETLGFDEYIQETLSVYQEHQNVMKKKEMRLNMRNKASVTQEELEREQEMLFLQARQKYNATLTEPNSPEDDEDWDDIHRST